MISMKGIIQPFDDVAHIPVQCFATASASGLLLAEMREGVAQGSAGDLNQPLERRVHLQDQKDRSSNRQGAPE